MSYTLDFPSQYIANPERFATIGLGKLYIGVVDGDPAAEPADRIQAYIARQGDTDLAIPQPIELSAGGVPVYLGSPVTLKINQSFSCAVLDKNGQQVYYSPKTGELIEEINNLELRIDELELLIDENAAETALIIDDVSAIAAYTPVAGRVYYLREYLSGSGVGGGPMQAFAGSITENLVDSFSASLGFYFRRINVKDLDFYMCGGLQSNSASLNDAAFTRAMSALSSGGTLRIPKGTFLISQTITAPAHGINLALDDNCTIDYSAVGTTGAWDYCAVYLPGSGSSITGGKNGGFLGAAAWDGANVTPTYAVIVITGDYCYVNTRLTNIRKVGVWFKDCSDGHLDKSIIVGGYPAGLWTGVETVHYGALFDPTTSPSRGNFKSTNNTIKSCVQGHLVGNYGVGQFVQGFVATGNIFEGCWNHGIYSNYTSGAVIVGNNFNRCQIMVVAGGPYNNVSGNTGYTDVDVVGDQRDIFGISMRDSIGCVCSNNTLKGVNVPASAVAISFQDFGLSAEMSNNVCSGNTIVSTAGNCIPIRFLSSSVPASRNIICNNNIDTLGVTSEGAISMFGSASNLSLGNKISGNTINLRGSGWGIYATYQDSIDVVDNTVIYAYNAASPVNVNTIAFFNCKKSKSDNNRSASAPTFGTSISVTGFIELGSSANNILSNSANAVAAPASYNTYQAIVNSNLTVNDSGPGAPGQTAAPGSQWRRTDGGASTTLYIKETANTSSTWRAV